MLLKTAKTALTSRWFDYFARAGYAAKGAVFGMVGILAARVALGDRGEQADFTGAMESVQDQPFNAVFLVVLAVGLTAYALWRVVQGLADVEGEGGDLMGWLKRSAYVVLGLWYGFFAVWVGSMLLGGRANGGEDEIRDWTALALGWPLGRWLVGAVGVGVMVSGLIEVYYAVARKFEVELGADHLGGFERVCLLCTGGLGHLARGVVFVAAGFFAIRAAVEFDPDEARGLAETFQELAGQPYGGWIVGAAAAGFIAFGLYCLLLAWHRHIPNEGMFRGRGES
jgi:hypothetical protein